MLVRIPVMQVDQPFEISEQFLLLRHIILWQFLLSMSLCNYIQEIVSLVHVSVNNGVSVGDRRQRDFVQVLSGSVIRYVEAILLN